MYLPIERWSEVVFTSKVDYQTNNKLIRFHYNEN